MAYAAFYLYTQAQRRAQAQEGQGGTGVTPAAPMTNGCHAPAEVVKIEEAVVNKVHVGGPLHAPGTSLFHSTRPVHTDLQPAIIPSRAVFCGERESSLPPGYRFRETSLPVEQSNGSHEVPKPLSDEGALESLSAGFTSSAPSAPLVEPQGEVPVDALNALSDILGAPEPVPEPPKIDPTEVVSEGTLVIEDAELVGEDEESIPPEYRFTENGTGLHPPEEEKPTMDPGAALDILSGDFMPAAPAQCPLPKQPCLEALDMLDGEFAAPGQTSPDETVGVISCGVGPAATLPSEIPVATVDSDLSGNMVSAQS